MISRQRDSIGLQCVHVVIALPSGTHFQIKSEKLKVSFAKIFNW